MNRYLGHALLFTTVALCLAEISARTYLGLGDPPLTIRDFSIEYMFAPSRCYRRFGNSICYNQWSMRSDDFASIKTNSIEKRVLVMGDSVINGGALTDQKDLATTLLQQRLSDCLQVPVVVGNVSAGSWGPGNILAYTRRYGWLTRSRFYRAEHE